jgi:hypothetical protein
MPHSSSASKEIISKFHFNHWQRATSLLYTAITCYPLKTKTISLLLCMTYLYCPIPIHVCIPSLKYTATTPLIEGNIVYKHWFCDANVPTTTHYRCYTSIFWANWSTFVWLSFFITMVYVSAPSYRTVVNNNNSLMHTLFKLVSCHSCYTDSYTFY